MNKYQRELLTRLDNLSHALSKIDEMELAEEALKLFVEVRAEFIECQPSTESGE